MQNYKELFTPEEVDTWASENFSSAVLDRFDLNKQPPLSPLSLYAGSISGRINAALRRGALGDSFSHFEGLQYDLCQNTIPEDITVWRYISFQELCLLWKATMFGRTYINPAFISTTLLRDAFSGQARQNHCVIQLNVPKGTPGAYITELKNAAIAEYEVLLPHHMALKRTGKRTYEMIPVLPPAEYRGEHVAETDYGQG